MKTMMQLNSRHTVHISKIEKAPVELENAECISGPLYVVRNWDIGGVDFFYTSKVGKQWFVWYRNGKLWTSYGDTMEQGLNGAQADGWLYASI